MHPDVAVVAYADDLFLVGPPSDLAAAYHTLTAAASAIGLEARPDKSRMFIPATDLRPLAEQLAPAGTDPALLVSGGVLVTGTPVGTADFVRTHVADLAEDAAARI